MTPFLIDDQKRRRYIAILILLLTVSFALGYASGFYMGILDKAEVTTDSSITSESPEPPSQEEQSPEAIEKSDAVPQPEVKSEVSPPAKTEKSTVTAPPPKTTKPSPVTVTPAKVTKSPSEAIAENKQEIAKPVSQKPELARPVAVVVKPKEPEQVAELQKTQVKPEESQPDAIQGTNMVTDRNTGVYQESQRMFSVQVGVFANQENAMNLVEELKDGGFDAYLDDFTASGGEVKYNVRFGRESDRNLIQQQLTKYKQQFSTSAYIIISK